MDADRRMPISTGTRDVREPLASFAEDMRLPPATIAIQTQAPKTAWDMKVSGAESVYGSAFAMSLSMDRALLAQFQRGPGLESSFSGLDTFLGRDDKIGFEDFMGLPEHRPDIPKYSVHELFQRKMGL